MITLRSLAKLFPLLLLLVTASATRAETVDRWGRWEKVLRGPSEGNPFAEVSLSARICRRGSADTLVVRGFYDGGGRYLIRFMPEEPGCYDYTTASNVAALDGRRGSFVCSDRPAGHGPVRPCGRHGFAYADGTPYHPFGTTAYAWVHMTPELQETTLRTFREAAFNKVRMCVMPKSYALCDKEPRLYPFAAGPGPDPASSLTGKSGRTFDLTRFSPEFFHNLEARIDDLADLGIEADLILFHPYDKGQWGFDALPAEVNRAYVEYVVARLASFGNVWWSLANEYDYVKAKTESDWKELIRLVHDCDPHRHPISIHGSTATYFPYELPEITHTSIQDEAPVMEPGRAAILHSIYRKPVILDEVCYEGNLPNRWGRLSGQEMLHRIWNGLIGGVYVTHGECIRRHYSEQDTIMWAEGGRLRGESWKRIRFTRDIVEAMPAPLRPADVSRDIRTATGGPGHYLVYFGKELAESWEFNLPAKCSDYEKLRPGTRFRVEIIDTWEMTITEWPEYMETGPVEDYRLYDVKHRRIRLPLAPYILLRITRL